MAPEGTTLEEYKISVDKLVKDVDNVDGVERAVSLFENPTGLSKDKITGIIQVQMTEASGEIDTDTVHRIHEYISEVNVRAG